MTFSADPQEVVDRTTYALCTEVDELGRLVRNPVTEALLRKERGFLTEAHKLLGEVLARIDAKQEVAA